MEQVIGCTILSRMVLKGFTLMVEAMRVSRKMKAWKAIGGMVAFGGKDGLLIDLFYFFLFGVSGLKLIF